MNDRDSIIAHTESWVTQIVKQDISHFARRKVDQDSIRYSVIEQTNSDDVLIEFVSECELLTNNTGTDATLLIIPNAFQCFDEFLELVGLANNVLIEHTLEGGYKLAHFHPDHGSAGTPPRALEKDANRSPYPCLYIIKEASMEYALENPKDTEQKQVWWEKPVKYANLMLAIGTTFLALGTGQFSHLMMVPMYLAIYFSIK